MNIDINDQNRYVKDGVYDITGIKYLSLNEKQRDRELTPEQEQFIKDNPNWVWAIAYQTYQGFLLSDKPRKFSGKVESSGFNYGTTSILDDCPKAILIVAQDD